MLIDLQWDKSQAKKRVKIEYCIEFDTSDGNLVTSWQFPNNKIFSTIIARRVHKGVYWSNLLYNEISNYTKYEIVHPWEESKRLLDLMEKSKDKNSIREIYYREILTSTYGNADNLKQIFKYGGKFIRSIKPYVLQLSLINQEHNGDWRWHKNGPYIGTHKHLGEFLRETPHIDNIIHFTFHELRLKNDGLA